MINRIYWWNSASRKNNHRPATFIITYRKETMTGVLLRMGINITDNAMSDFFLRHL